MRTRPGSNLLRSSKAGYIGMLVLGAIFFGLAYSQSPLFTSNQNQYFLHGLAAAGFGYLRADWLANTADPTPLYSFLVELTYLIFKSSIPFYLYYYGLLGLYYFFLIGLVKKLTDDLVPQKIALLGIILLILHSALWRYLLTLTLGQEWAYVVEGGLANQRLLGVVFQPSTFGMFLFGAVYAFVIGKDVLLAIIPNS